MTNSRNRSAIGIILLVAVFFIILMIFAIFTMRSLGDASDSLSLGSSSKKIAVVEINGVIMESKKIIEKLFKAEKNKSLKAIILRINSPGGAVGPVQEIYEEVVRIDKKIPIIASFGVISASGGYYIGSAAREIYANPGTLTGSIGVIMQFMNFEKLFELAKVKQETIKAGLYKDIGSPSRSMKDVERDILNTTMQKVHKQFISDIEKRRGKRIKGDINALAQGQIFSGEEAYESGLIDHLGSMWKAGRDIYKKYDLKGEPEYLYIKENKKTNIFKILENLGEVITPIAWKGMVGSVPMFLHQ